MNLNYLINDYRIRFDEAVNFDYYKDKIDQEAFNWLCSLDPTTDKKYSRWIIEWFIKEKVKPAMEAFNSGGPSSRPNNRPELAFPLSSNDLMNVYQIKRFINEDSYKVTDDLKMYIKLKNKKLLGDDAEYNIMNIKGFGSLWDLIHNKYTDEIAEMQENEPLGSEEYDKLFENEEYTVVVPKTHRAACKYGANTRWCTASRDDDTYFKSYTKDGPLVIIIDKTAFKGKGAKFQLHFESNQWMDENDDEIEDRALFIGELPKEVKSAIYDYTHRFVFHPNKKEFITKAFDGTHQELANQFISAIGNAGISVTSLEEANIESLSDVFDSQLVSWAASDVVMENGYFEDDSSYSYAYDHPWEFTHDEPALKDEADKCDMCIGTGFQLPTYLTEPQYINVSQTKDIEPGLLNSIIKSYTPVNDGYRLSREYKDTVELAKKVNSKCKNCKGSGLEGSIHNADLYSDEQREKVAQEAEQSSYDDALNDFVRSIDRYNSRNNDTRIINDILDKMLNLLAEALHGGSIKEHLETVINLFDYGFIDIPVAV